MPTTATLPSDLQTPAVIDHLTFIGNRQLKRVDSVEFGVDTDPRVRRTLGVDDLDRPLARLKGDTCDAQGRPVGTIRGWQTYVYADEPLDVLRLGLMRDAQTIAEGVAAGRDPEEAQAELDLLLLVVVDETGVRYGAKIPSGTPAAEQAAVARANLIANGGLPVGDLTVER